MKICKHTPHTVYTRVKAPKYSTDEILLNKDLVDRAEPILIIRFSDESPKEKYGWFIMGRKMIRQHRTQSNGRGVMYVVPMRKREKFEQIKPCEHMNAELF